MIFLWPRFSGVEFYHIRSTIEQEGILTVVDGYGPAPGYGQKRTVGWRPVVGFLAFPT